jgi:hypothetical protein
VIQTDIKFGAMEKIDVDVLQKACSHDWFNQTMCKVNDSLVRLGIFKGEFHWHQHDKEDEFFYVVEGKWSLGTVLDFVTLGNAGVRAFIKTFSPV